MRFVALLRGFFFALFAAGPFFACSPWDELRSRRCDGGSCEAILSCSWCNPGTSGCRGGDVYHCQTTGGCNSYVRSEECADGESCSFGHCSTSCTNECNTGESRCAGPSGFQVCGQDDDDSCLDWMVPVSCSRGETCSFGRCASSCQSECSIGEIRCLDTGLSLCTDSNGDGCLEWSPRTECERGLGCAGRVGPAGQTGVAHCEDIASCRDECSVSQCLNYNGVTTLFSVCGNFDRDSCLEPSPGSPCLSLSGCAPTCSANGCGTACDSPVDAGVASPCDPNPCLHGGTCSAEDAAAVCECTALYEGPDCALSRPEEGCGTHLACLGFEESPAAAWATWGSGSSDLMSTVAARSGSHAARWSGNVGAGISRRFAFAGTPTVRLALRHVGLGMSPADILVLRSEDSQLAVSVQEMGEDSMWIRVYDPSTNATLRSGTLAEIGDWTCIGLRLEISSGAPQGVLAVDGFVSPSFQVPFPLRDGSRFDEIEVSIGNHQFQRHSPEVLIDDIAVGTSDVSLSGCAAFPTR